MCGKLLYLATAASEGLTGNQRSTPERARAPASPWSHHPAIFFAIATLSAGCRQCTAFSRMALGQGHFDMCDVTCSACNAAVGYRFCSAIDDHNVNHVGRAGLVLSCVHLRVDDIQAAALYASIQGSRKLNRQRSRQQPRTSHVQRSVTEPLSRTAMLQ